MYNNWSFLSTIFRGSNIQVHGKELGNQANAFAQNAKRKISAIDEVEKAKRGRSMDGILKCGEVEYGCIEIDQNTDSTKELKDSRLKLPIVMKDMFLKIYHYAPELQHKIHIVGYNINGPSIQLLDLDSPKGYVTRIRRTLANDYPTSKKDLTVRISSLARLAALGKTIVKETETMFEEFDKGLAPALSDTFSPPCFTIKAGSKTSSSSSSSSQSNSIKNKKKQLSSTHTSQESST
ncbi:hypothetical protein INT45_008939 [Circinella minor]|uniref:Uncharacterized protein n=1 Tax=Circinella minor TaxID=1195481 RepID=A0A8H7S5K3_9FUNG|nr:hypothetical protein INT45_008939 [Circinella minor]